MASERNDDCHKEEASAGLPRKEQLGSRTLTRGADFELRPVSSARRTEHIKRD